MKVTSTEQAPQQAAKKNKGTGAGAPASSPLAADSTGNSLVQGRQLASMCLPPLDPSSSCQSAPPPPYPPPPAALPTARPPLPTATAM